MLRNRPLGELADAIKKLENVVLFHPQEISVRKPSVYCVCRKGEYRSKNKTNQMVCCDTCWEWYHRDCVGISDTVDMSKEVWVCEWCSTPADSLGRQKWTTNRKKAKFRFCRDTPRALGLPADGERPEQWSIPLDWEGKVSLTREQSQRAAQKNRKLKVAVQKLVDEGSIGGHHLTDAQGIEGLEHREVDDALVDELWELGHIGVDDSDEDSNDPEDF